VRINNSLPKGKKKHQTTLLNHHNGGKNTSSFKYQNPHNAPPVMVDTPDVSSSVTCEVDKFLGVQLHHHGTAARLSENGKR
jgi:hypothetical protein